MKVPDRGDWVLPLNGFQNGDGEKGKRVLRFSRKSVPFCWSSFPKISENIFRKKSLKLSFYDLQGIKLNLALCRKQVDRLFLFTVYIIVKLLLKIMQENMLQFGSPFRLCSRGEGQW